MDKRAKKAIGKNRVKILGLDYFDLTGPLLAADILPIKKHKDIKTEAPTNKARIDLLLEWIDEGYDQIELAYDDCNFGSI